MVEDGPTLTHGGMPHGAGWRAAVRHGAAAVVDPRPWATGSVGEAFRPYPHIGPVLPALGYGAAMIAELEQTVNAVPADVVVAGTPVGLTRILRVNKPVVRARHEFREVGGHTLADLLRERFGVTP